MPTEIQVKMRQTHTHVEGLKWSVGSQPSLIIESLKKIKIEINNKIPTHIRLHSKRLHTIIKMNEQTKVDITNTVLVNVRSQLNTG